MLATPQRDWRRRVCPGSEPEYLRHPLGQVIFGHRGADLDGRQFQALCFLAEKSGEQPVSLEQVTQCPVRITGLAGDLPQRSRSEPRLANAARRNSGAGRSQTA